LNRWRSGVQRSKLWGIPNGGLSELGVQSGHKTQPACFCCYSDHLFQRIILEAVLFFQHKNTIEVDT